MPKPDTQRELQLEVIKVDDIDFDNSKNDREFEVELTAFKSKVVPELETKKRIRKPLSSYAPKFHLSVNDKLQFKQLNVHITKNLNCKFTQMNKSDIFIASYNGVNHSNTQREMDSPMILSRLTGKS